MRREDIMKGLGRLTKEYEIIKEWKKEEIQENLRYICDNVHCIIQNKKVKTENELEIGKRISPTLAEIIIKRWKEENVDGEIRIRKSKRYVDDRKGKIDELEKEVKGMEVEDNIYILIGYEI